ncbi:MAG: biotin--[acetyl-CoA-carboxylase] ligase [Bacteroidia bacterium]|nr:biotin--[acetyl-CoA-carboxylase] ligase [Bacteroidia bacterium]GIV24222.1 MAG: hypothetical protein KatS3mg025_1881 [Bacteroidia bacterium]
MALRFRRYFFEELPSTQAYLKAWAEREAVPQGTLVWTRHQTAGYGRKGTPWHATPGESLTFSFLVSPAEGTDTLTVRTALAVYDTLAPHLHEPLFLKWPNDLWTPTGKLAGLLTEAVWQGSKLRFACIGIGINVYQRSFPPSLRATSIALSGTPPTQVESLLEVFEAHFFYWYEAPVPKVQKRFMERLLRKGQFLIHENLIEGTITAWETEGFLRIETATGTHRYPASAVQVVWPPSS